MRSAFSPATIYPGSGRAILLGELAAILRLVTLDLIQVPMPVGSLSQSYPPPTVTMVTSNLSEGKTMQTYAGLIYSHGRCQDGNCKHCYGERMRELAADAKKTLHAVEKLNRGEPLYGVEAQDLFRPLREPDDPSLHLIFGPGLQTIEPEPYENVTGHSIDEVELFLIGTADTAPSAESDVKAFARCLSDGHSYTDYVASQPYRHRRPTVPQDPAEPVFERTATLRGTGAYTGKSGARSDANASEKPVVGNLGSQFIPAGQGVSGQPTKRPIGRPRKWNTGAERKAASRARPVPAITPAVEVPRARDIVTIDRPRRQQEPSAAQLASAQDGRCCYCDREFGSWVLKGATGELAKLRAEKEHFTPRRLGRSSGDDNLRAACQICNGFKSDHVFDSIEACRAWLNETWALNEYQSIAVRQCSHCDGTGFKVAA